MGSNPIWSSDTFFSELVLFLHLIFLTCMQLELPTVGSLTRATTNQEGQFTDFVTLVNEKMELEKYIAITTNKLHSFNKKWSNFLSK